VASDPSQPAARDPANEAAEFAQIAADYLQAGRRDVAELYAFAALDADPRNATARKLLARIALGLHRPERAAAWLRPVRKVAATDSEFVALAAEAEQMRVAAPGHTRYLLIREWSAGFWSDVDHVLGMCVLAELTGRVPLVWWGAQSRFASSAGGNNAWEQFFAPLSDATLEDIERLPRYPEKWTAASLTGPVRSRWTGPGSRLSGLELLDRQEDLVISDFHSGMRALLSWLPASHPLARATLQAAYRSLARKYLRPHPEIVAEADRFAAARFGTRPMIAAHMRGSDKVEEVNELDGVLAGYFRILDERLAARPDAGLFVLTDDERVRATCEARYGTRLVMTPCARSGSNVGVHFLPDRDPVRTGVEVMVDSLLATRCSEFIGLAASNVSLYVSYLKDWAPDSCHLINENAHELWNVVPLLMDPPPGAD
jgi:protein O-GlcNAc transferase